MYPGEWGLFYHKNSVEIPYVYHHVKQFAIIMKSANKQTLVLLHSKMVCCLHCKLSDTHDK